MLSKLNNWLKNTHFWQLPESCLLCKVDCRGGLCADCAAELAFQQHPCERCGIGLASKGVCGQCQQHPPLFDSAWSMFEYRQPLNYLIKRMKFNADLVAARVLGVMMADALKRRVKPIPQVIIPVPLSLPRLRERGFNQAFELARPIGKALKLKIDFYSCRRIRDTAPQTDLDAQQRRKNLLNAFACKPLDYKHVAIIDDVMTTAATVENVTATLKEAGVEVVDVWVCARSQI
jgi:ComF family protein